jgi:hypothetical protein
VRALTTLLSWPLGPAAVEAALGECLDRGQEHPAVARREPQPSDQAGHRRRAIARRARLARLARRHLRCVAVHAAAPVPSLCRSIARHRGLDGRGRPGNADLVSHVASQAAVSQHQRRNARLAVVCY